ncbi:MucB/RseB C-terminal domain-containing protein [Alloalcanivorax mobilis]|uniref:MucB/RseB C-terminal domain-containing protein n=1 Tax=Alloalcanivorax mobilis TaxID=2019569 RepID=UPI000B5B0E6A|nr:MucB/RseB C-terminal domain-containing protein [Alloalcanivorax mobilis]ASK33486.1 nucleoside transporter [Alcanivorax sp. N3-2A]|tara:strand:- start:40665 stop:41624 length:960 start_codon:yes stop_codon:yes gene_type:complete
MIRLLALGLTLVTPLAFAAASPAQTLLAEMAQASKGLDYQGRFLYQFGAEVSTMEVRHAVFDGEEYQRLTHLDGRLVEVLRLGDELVALHPNGTLTRITDGGTDLLTFRDRLSSSIPDQYNVLVDGDGRVAGRAATRMRVAPLDNHRYGYRLWIDDESYLMLKSEMVDAGGMALERVEFVTLNLDPALNRADFQVPKVLSERALENVPASQSDRVRVQASWLPGGFEAVDRDWRRVGEQRAPVAAQSFSDGLATFTVFVEAVDTEQVEEGVSRVGPTVAISRHLDVAGQSYLVSLIGEIPQPTAERVMQAVRLSPAPAR